MRAKNIKKKLFLLLSICSIIFSCSNETNNETNSTYRSLGKLVRIKGSPTKSIFTGKYESSTTNSRTVMRTVSNDIIINHALLTINSKGEIEPIQFLDSNGNAVIVNVTKIKKLTDDSVLLSFNAVSFLDYTKNEIQFSDIKTEEGTCLINFSMNKIYDLKGYCVDISYYSDGILFISKENGALYKIDLSTPERAIPLNNPDFNAVNCINFLCDDWLIVQHGLLIDPNGIKPPKVLNFDYDLPVIGSWHGSPSAVWGDRTCAFIKDGLNQIWIFVHDHTNCYYYRINLDDDGHLYTFDEPICDTRLTPIDTIHYGYHLPGTCENVRNGATDPVLATKSMWISKQNSGNSYYLISVQGKTEGGLDISCTELNYTSGLPKNNYVFLNDAMYWYKSGKILKMDLLSGVESVEYENPSMISRGFSATGGKIIFYIYENATTVNTYSLDLGSNTPVLVSKSEMEIENIIELNF